MRAMARKATGDGSGARGAGGGRETSTGGAGARGAGRAAGARGGGARGGDAKSAGAARGAAAGGAKGAKAAGSASAKGAGAKAGHGAAGARAASASVDPRLLRTRAMCQRRAPRDPDLGIAPLIAAIARDAKRASDGLGAAAEAWEREMPPALVAETWIESATATLLLIGVPSAAVAYAVDRALAGGALMRIRAALRLPGLRVRTRQGRAPRA